jgi:hypothetical protein
VWFDRNTLKPHFDRGSIGSFRQAQFKRAVECRQVLVPHDCEVVEFYKSAAGSSVLEQRDELSLAVGVAVDVALRGLNGAVAS